MVAEPGVFSFSAKRPVGSLASEVLGSKLEPLPFAREARRSTIARHIGCSPSRLSIAAYQRRWFLCTDPNASLVGLARHEAQTPAIETLILNAYFAITGFQGHLFRLCAEQTDDLWRVRIRPDAAPRANGRHIPLTLRALASLLAAGVGGSWKLSPKIIWL